MGTTGGRLSTSSLKIINRGNVASLPEKNRGKHTSGQPRHLETGERPD